VRLEKNRPVVGVNRRVGDFKQHGCD
jgi:hypothetical protein